MGCDAVTNVCMRMTRRDETATSDRHNHHIDLTYIMTIHPCTKQIICQIYTNSNAYTSIPKALSSSNICIFLLRFFFILNSLSNLLKHVNIICIVGPTMCYDIISYDHLLSIKTGFNLLYYICLHAYLDC